jgi:hydroxypyruvate isomerase
VIKDMKYSVCISAVFHGRDVFQSLVQIKDLGIDTFEFWKWWDIDLTPYQRAIDELNMKISCFCTKSFCLTDASLRDQYLDDLKTSIATAKMLGVNKLITQVGNELPDIPRTEQHRNIVNGLKACAPILEDAGITLVFEPLNTLVDHKGYYLYSSDEAFEIQEEVNSSFVNRRNKLSSHIQGD